MARVSSRQLTRVATIAVTAAIAVSAGRFMQTDGDPVASALHSQAGFLMTATQTPPQSSAVEASTAGIAQVEEVIGLAGRPAPPAEPVVPTGPSASGTPGAVVAPAVPADEVPDTPFLYVDGKPACPADLKVTAVPGGMAYLAFDAPCQRGRPVSLGHAGLSASVAVPVSGRLAQLVPVLEPAAPFTIELMDGAVIAASLPEPSAEAFEHVVLQVSDMSGFRLHAFEFGAGYGDPGHVWGGAPKEALRAIRGEGGFLTRVGDPDLGDAAEVYTFPVGEMARHGVVELTVELQVTAANCGKDASAELLERDFAGELDRVAISVAVPGCDAIGDILVLKNILQDLKIAAN